MLNDLQFYENTIDFWKFMYISSLSLLGKICKFTFYVKLHLNIQEIC